MNKLFLNWKWMIRQIIRDPLLLAASFAPFLIGALAKSGTAAVLKHLPAVIDFMERYQYGKLIDLFLSQISPLMLLLAVTMIVMEEKDEGTQRYFFITPGGRGGYFTSRFSLAALLSLVINLTVLCLFSLETEGFFPLGALGFWGILPSVLITCLVLHIAENRLAAMAVLKISSVTLFGLFIPFFIGTPWQYLFSFLPAFWIAKGMLADRFALCLVAIPVLLLWIFLMRMGSKINRVKIVE